MDVLNILCAVAVLVSVNGLDMPEIPGIPGISGMPDIGSLSIGGDMAGSEVADAIGTCKKKLQVSPADLMKIAKQEVPKSKDGICFMACVQKEIGIIGPDNKYNLDVVRVKFERMKTANSDLYALTMQAFEDCVDAGVHERDECKAYAKLQACMKGNKADATETIVDTIKMIG